MLSIKSNTMSTTERVLGQVKWFNNKAGYGFITLSTEDPETQGKDIFVHYSSIRVTNSQYKFLTQGEYVEFVLEKSTSDKHEYQANDITGLKGGKLMCEVRRIFVPQDGDRAPTTQIKYRRYEREETAGGDEDGFQKQQPRRKPYVRKPRVALPSSA
jgi:cold shock CspA family protein